MLKNLFKQVQIKKNYKKIMINTYNKFNKI